MEQSDRGGDVYEGLKSSGGAGILPAEKTFPGKYICKADKRMESPVAAGADESDTFLPDTNQRSRKMEKEHGEDEDYEGQSLPFGKSVPGLPGGFLAALPGGAAGDDRVRTRGLY
jgi:hypothetical protein